MTMSKRKEPGQYGDTHYFTLNEWSPEGNNNNTGNAAPQNNASNQNNTGGDISVEDIPF
ncbi:MAG: hypothetical protein GY828_06520 [Candidatus Gracilibacteria bacterium]|nr:hypothetical protein [Candidatus Gracilibacteria bacterium]